MPVVLLHTKLQSNTTNIIIIWYGIESITSQILIFGFDEKILN